MFADDLLLFGEATINQTRCMMRCLDTFCEASGEKISIAKSSIFFSPRVPLGLKQSIADITGMHISTEIGCYLGFPLSRKRKTTETFNYIVDKVRLKLST